MCLEWAIIVILESRCDGHFPRILIGFLPLPLVYVLGWYEDGQERAAHILWISLSDISNSSIAVK